MQKLFKWFLMLNKRLYKKITFVMILILIPISVLALQIVAKEDSGFLHVVLVQMDANDSISVEIMEELLNEESIIRFSEASDKKEAIKMVETGRADAAWVFPSDMRKKIEDYQEAVTIVIREQNVFLRLTQEKLFASLYEYCAKTQYLKFARANVQELDALSDQELLQYFDNVNVNEDLFVYGDRQGENGAHTNSDYLMSPLRGLFSVLIMLCCMAAMMYYMQDENSGTFSWVPETNRIYVAFFCLFIATLNVATVSLISLYMAGLATSLLREIVNILLYAICCTMFCLLLRYVIRSIRLYGATIPLFTVVMIAICPVFFDFRSVQGIQLLFPPTYYINAVYDKNYQLYMLGYIVGCGCLGLVIRRARKCL